MSSFGKATFVLVVAMAQATGGTIDPARAKLCFAEVRAAAAEDGGRLWGTGLDGPLLLADPDTLEVAANQRDAAGVLREQDGVWVGRLDPGTVVANTALEWSGTRWAMVRWPLPEALVDRRQLLLHELWHRIQGDLGLPAEDPPNAHLDDPDARWLMQLEWRALAAALRAESESERRASCTDALVFRAQRHALFPAARAQETRLEVHEGLAEYTGVALRGTNPGETRAAHAARMLAPPAEGSWVRGFAYRSGPAYGLLLDACAVRWRGGLATRSDVGELLRAALAFELPADVAAEVEQRGARYGSAELRAAEQRAAAELAARRAALRALLVEGPVLELELARPNIGFDPGAVVSLDAEGTVYLGGKLVDAWGILETDEPLRVSWPAMRAWIAAPPEAATEGEGWKLALAPGWKLAPGARPGDLRAVQSER